MSPGQRPSPADLGKAGCSWPRPPAATADHPAQKGHQPEPLNRIPHHQGLPAPAAWHDPLPDGRVKGACGAAARALRAPVTRPPARRIRQLSGDREQTQASPDQGDHDRRNPEIERLRSQADAGKAGQRAVIKRSSAVPPSAIPATTSNQPVYLCIAALGVNVLICRCDTRSHLARGLADRRAD